MAYTPTTCVTGDTITAVKLNNMEQGIANAGALVVTITSAQDEINLKLDKTWQEIHDAVLSGGVSCVRRDVDEGFEYISINVLQNVDYEMGVGYMVVVADEVYIATTANDYPQTNFEG